MDSIKYAVLYARPPIEVDALDYIEGFFTALTAPLHVLLFLISDAAEYTLEITLLLGAFILMALLGYLLSRYKFDLLMKRKYLMYIPLVFVLIGMAIIWYIESTDYGVYIRSVGFGFSQLLYDFIRIMTIVHVFVAVVSWAISAGLIIEGIRRKLNKQNTKEVFSLFLVFYIVAVVSVVFIPGYWETFGEEVEMRLPNVPQHTL